MHKILHCILFLFFATASLPAQQTDTTSTDSFLKQAANDFIDMDFLDDALSARYAMSVASVGLVENKPLASFIKDFSVETKIGIGLMGRIEIANMIWHCFDVKNYNGTYQDGQAMYGLLFNMRFVPNFKGEERYYSIKIEVTKKPNGIRDTKVSEEQWTEFDTYIEKINKDSAVYQNGDFKNTINSLITRGLFILLGIADFPIEVGITPLSGSCIDSLSHFSYGAPYEQVVINGKNKNITNVSLGLGETMSLQALIHRKEMDTVAKNITLSNGTNFKQELISFDSVKSFTYIAGRMGDDAITATYELKHEDKTLTETAGKLNISVYNKKQPFKVKIVPVNITIPSNEQEFKQFLNSVYGQAIVSWDVTIESKLNLSKFDNKLDVESGAFSNYSSEMNSIISAYKNANKIDKETYYIFLVQGFENSEVIGYMPMKRSYGFVAYSTNPKRIARTIAHELGHGAFRLRHTFDEYPALKKWGTDNLMDYNTSDPASLMSQMYGTPYNPEGAELRVSRLYKYQWDHIHNPEGGLYWFQDEEDVMAFGQSGTEYLCISDENALSALNGEYKKFCLPDGRIIDLTGTKYKVSGFYTQNDPTESAQGAVYSIRSDKYDLIHIYSTTKKEGSETYATFGYGHKFGDVSVTEVFEEDLPKITDLSDAVRVYVDQTNKRIGIYNAKTKEFIKFIPYKSECNCNRYLKENDYFVTDKVSAEYVNFAKKNGKKVDYAIAEESTIVNDFVSLAARQQNTYKKSSEELGVVFADKLEAYEGYNNRRFIVVFKEVDFISTRQTSWDDLADVVFRRAMLKDRDILITIPYVICEGVASGDKKIFYMPGLAKGINSRINTTSIRNDYCNTKPWAAVEAGGKPEGVFAFVTDVFTHTYKKYQRNVAFINFRGDIIECEPMNEESMSGFPGTFDFRLFIDSRKKQYIETENSLRNQSHYAKNQDVFIAKCDSIRRTFTETYPNLIPVAVNHGLKESCCFEQTVREQFSTWFRDREFKQLQFFPLTYQGEKSPSGDKFYLGKNQVEYDETLDKIMAFGVVLSFVGQDWIADFAGAIYAGCYGDATTSALFTSATIIPIVNAAAVKSIGKTMREAFIKGEAVIMKKEGQIAAELVKDLNIATRGTFTQRQIDEYVRLATKIPEPNPNSNKVLLGRYIKKDPTSYHIKAKNEGYTYFQLDDWDEIQLLVNKSDDEMWKINKQFIDQQKTLNKEFYFSHNPWEIPTGSFSSRETEYLIDLGVKDFVEVEKGKLWKVIW